MEDFINELHERVKAKRAEAFSKSGQMSLGDMITKMQEILDKHESSKEEIAVHFDFCYTYPTKIDSWRGIYAELALNWRQYPDYGNKTDTPLTAKQFLELLKSANGTEYTGYKGGTFRMSLSTPVWVDNYGHSSNTAVFDIKDEGYQVIIVTRKQDSHES
jgi:hypothetical protein